MGVFVLVEFDKKMANRLVSVTDKGATAAARMYHRDLIKVLSRTGEGEEYTKDGETFVAGAKGEPPARGKGEYLQSIKVRPARQSVKALVYTTEDVGEWLEEGDHPHFRTVFEANKHRYIEAFQDIGRKAFEEGF